MAHMYAKGRRTSGTCSNEIALANSWRRAKIDALVAACESGVDESVERARLPLLNATDSPKRVGFARTDLEHFLGVLTKRLDGGFVREDGSKSRGIRSAFTGKMNALGRSNDRISRLGGRVKHEVLKERDRVAEEAKSIHSKIDVLECAVLAIRVSMDERLRPRVMTQVISVPVEKEITVEATHEA